MEHLIELIRNEFELAHYKSIDNTRFWWRHLKFNDFWLIYPLEGDFDLESLQEQIYSDLAPFRKDYPESEKNTSLLILQLVNDDQAKNHQQVINGENNVYYFKKYIIQFTLNDWTSTEQVIPTDYQTLGKMLMEPYVFEQVKNDENSPYSLLYTIAHKLPFIMMKTERKDYNPNPAFDFDAELQPIFAWTEGFSDMAGKNATNEELNAAKVAIDNLINSERNE